MAYFLIKRKYILICICLLLCGFSNPSVAQESQSTPSFSESKLRNQARKHTRRGEYGPARIKYLKLIELKPDHFNYNYELALNYYFSYHNKEEAIPYFEKALKNSKKDTVGEIYFYLGELYQISNKLDKALENYNHMKRFVKENKAGQELLIDINNKIAQSFQGKVFSVSVDKKVKIENLGSNINSRYPDYSPVMSKDNTVLIFTTRRISNTGGKIDYEDEKYFEDMYIARKVGNDFAPAEKFLISDEYVGLIPNSPEHDAVVSFSVDETLLFTYRENSIWVSELKPDGTWLGPVKLNENINVKKGYQPHASISPDGKTIYFSSERKGGIGGIDLYKSYKQVDGTWGPAVNLGPEINTKFDEDSPFISHDGKRIYFSSKGHNSIGGYDIFYSDFIEGKWSKPISLGRPVNSMADDTHFTIDSTGKYSYFASSRPEGLGDMDIYRITFLDGPEFVECIALTGLEKDDEQQARFISFTLPDTIIAGKEANFNILPSRVKDSKITTAYWEFGEENKKEGTDITHVFPDRGMYEVKMELEAFHNERLTTDNFCVRRTIMVFSEEELKSILAAREEQLRKEKENEEAIAFGKSPVHTKETEGIIAERLRNATNEATEESQLGLQSILFGFNEDFISDNARAILDRNIEILKANPKITIKVIAHADSRGRARYNYWLSARRAETVSNYMIKNGISQRRIVSVVAKGSRDLAVKCPTTNDCSEEQHELNRRAEFVIAGKKK
jgi:outer membrane protein OmpA-like peptidoglycan-associated protein